MTKTNLNGLLDGLPDSLQADVRAEGRVLEFLLEVSRRMDETGVGPRELARRLDTSPGQVSRWLRAERGINARSMFRIAEALGFTLDVKWQPVEAPVVQWGEVVHLRSSRRVVLIDVSTAPALPTSGALVA